MSSLRQCTQEVRFFLCVIGCVSGRHTLLPAHAHPAAGAPERRPPKKRLGKGGAFFRRAKAPIDEGCLRVIRNRGQRWLRDTMPWQPKWAWPVPNGIRRTWRLRAPPLRIPPPGWTASRQKRTGACFILVARMFFKCPIFFCNAGCFGRIVRLAGPLSRAQEVRFCITNVTETRDVLSRCWLRKLLANAVLWLARFQAASDGHAHKFLS